MQWPNKAKNPHACSRQVRSGSHPHASRRGGSCHKSPHGKSSDSTAIVAVLGIVATLATLAILGTVAIADE
jgi:hypothetical protein